MTDIVSSENNLPAHEERKLRENLSRYLVVMVICLCFYMFVLAQIKHLQSILPSPSYVTTGLLIVFMIALITMIFSSDYPLSQYGLTFKNGKRSFKEGVLFSLPVLGVLLLLKWTLVHFVLAYQDTPVFNFHASIHVKDTLDAHVVWLETLFLYSLVIAPLQELIARGGLQGALTLFLTGKRRQWIAIFITSLVFSTTHLAYPLEVVGLSFLGGLFWGWLFARHKTIIGATVSHVLTGVWFFWFLGGS